MNGGAVDIFGESYVKTSVAKAKKMSERECEKVPNSKIVVPKLRRTRLYRKLCDCFHVKQSTTKGRKLGKSLPGTEFKSSTSWTKGDDQGFMLKGISRF